MDIANLKRYNFYCSEGGQREIDHEVSGEYVKFEDVVELHKQGNNSRGMPCLCIAGERSDGRVLLRVVKDCPQHGQLWRA